MGSPKQRLKIACKRCDDYIDMDVDVPDGRAELTPDDAGADEAGAEEAAEEATLPDALEAGAKERLEVR